MKHTLTEEQIRKEIRKSLITEFRGGIFSKMNLSAALASFFRGVGIMISSDKKKAIEKMVANDPGMKKINKELEQLDKKLLASLDDRYKNDERFKKIVDSLKEIIQK